MYEAVYVWRKSLCGLTINFIHYIILTTLYTWQFQLVRRKKYILDCNNSEYNGNVNPHALYQNDVHLEMMY